jgi:putative Mg2+ transporter-C (MgtC) family protein
MFGAGSSFDPSRIASQIIVGVGFLAGGLIIFHKDHLQGLTTSAGLWVAAGIGMAVGFKLYAIAIFVTVLTLLIFGLFWQIEQKIVASEGGKQK